MISMDILTSEFWEFAIPRVIAQQKGDRAWMHESR